MIDRLHGYEAELPAFCYSLDSLMHYGIKNMRWGVRRFQNEDMTWTEAGKIRYGDGPNGLEARKERREKQKHGPVGSSVKVKLHGKPITDEGGKKVKPNKKQQTEKPKTEDDSLSNDKDVKKYREISDQLKRAKVKSRMAQQYMNDIDKLPKNSKYAAQAERNRAYYKKMKDDADRFLESNRELQERAEKKLGIESEERQLKKIQAIVQDYNRAARQYNALSRSQKYKNDPADKEELHKQYGRLKDAMREFTEEYPASFLYQTNRRKQGSTRRDWNEIVDIELGNMLVTRDEKGRVIMDTTNARNTDWKDDEYNYRRRVR